MNLRWWDNIKTSNLNQQKNNIIELKLIDKFKWVFKYIIKYTYWNINYIKIKYFEFFLIV